MASKRATRRSGGAPERRVTRAEGAGTGAPAADRAASAPWPSTWLAIAIVVISGIGVYVNAWSGPFVFDDRATVIDNTQIRDLSSVRAVFSPPVETPVAGRPIANLTFAINYASGGLDVTGYHGVNILLHVLCGVLIFEIIRRTWRPLPALAAAILWIVHPLNTEAVDYISQRTEGLMACAFLATIYAGIRALTLNAPARGLWTLAAVIACAVGMACKETMVVAPVVMVLYDRSFVCASFAEAWRARYRLYAGLAATWTILVALQLTHPRSLSAGFDAPDAAPWTYLLNQTRLIAHYLRLSVWPSPLALFYGAPQPLTLGDVWPYAAVLCVLLAVTGWALMRHPRVGFLGAWFFLTLAPASSIVPISTEVGAERRMYLPLIALVVVAIVTADAVARRGGMSGPAARRMGIGVLAAIVTVLAGVTLARNRDYTSSLRLAETTAAAWPTAAADSMLGTELAAAGRLADAEVALRRAAATYEPARYYLGTVLAARGQSAEAIAAFEGYVRTAIPSLAEVRKARGFLSDLYARAGRWPDAIAQDRAILAGDPDDPLTHGRLADALVSTQAYAEAVPHYQALLAARPEDVRALGGLGIALAQSGQIELAIAAFQRAVDLEPRNPRTQQNLARALLAAGRRDEARLHAQQAAALAPGDPATQELLGRIK